MDVKVSPLKPRGLSPSDCTSDPEEKEVSDEDDDDRNHKHRRREMRSQSLERETVETIFRRPYRKRNKPFENGHLFRENESQGGEGLKRYNVALDKGFTTGFEKRRPGLASVSQVPLDFNQRIRPNQTFSGEPGSGRGRGRDSWNQHDSRFSTVDIASQMVPQGPINPSLFPGRGLPNVPITQNSSWSAFGLIPGIPNGGLDTHHSIHLQGTLRPSVNSSLNMAIPLQRCRDFEERGYCLRGDLCPMEHGVNRIVVEDVQSLSQFNLPVSIPSAQLVRTPIDPGSLPSIGTPSALINRKGLHNLFNKAGMVDNALGINGTCSGAAGLAGADLYDPDQPLWNNDGLETSNEPLAIHSPGGPKEIHSSKNEETESLMSGLQDDGESEGLTRSTGITVGSRSSSRSVWGRIRCLKNRSDMKEKIDFTVSTSGYLGKETKEDQDGLANVQGNSHQGKQIIDQDAGPRTIDSFAKTQIDPVRMRKPSQKASRTLFVNGIPQKSNKRGALLSHFGKFGEVIDIFIPVNSERAFVQFAKRENAEAALRAPDAVMGNRFIKLWWANRDNIPDDMSNSNSVFVTSYGATAASVPPHPSATIRGKDDLQSAASKGAIVAVSDTPTDFPKPVITNGPKVPPPLQKKLEIEKLKEELRKKQELLDQKRNDFRRQLHKLEKQATGIKSDVAAEFASKRHKVGMANDVTKAMTARYSDPGASVTSPSAGMMVDQNKSVENVVSSNPKPQEAMVLQESTCLKQPIHPLTSAGDPYLMNRYKLDTVPTAFRIIPPLPAGLANVSALKEYFSSYGDLSAVELEEVEPSDNDHDESEMPKTQSACVTFTTHCSAERAFLNGKCWQGNNLQFMWVTSGSSSNDPGVGENFDHSPDYHKDANVQLAENLVRGDSQEAPASVNGEPEDLGRNSGADHLELCDVSESCLTSISSEKKSSKHEQPDLTSFSGEEESTRCEVGGTGTTAMTGEKQLPKGDFC